MVAMVKSIKFVCQNWSLLIATTIDTIVITLYTDSILKVVNSKHW